MNTTGVKLEIDFKNEYIKSENEFKIKEGKITVEDLEAFASHSQDFDIEEGQKEEESDTFKICSESLRQELIEGEERINEKYDTEEFNCLNCNFIFDNEDDLVSHLESSCKGKISCSQFGCDRNCESDLKTCPLKHKTADKNSVKRKIFTCSQCSFKCTYKSSLKRHLLIHRNTKLFKCSECNYECNRKESLNSHLLTHRNTTLFKCSECNYECNRNENLKRHFLTHGNVKLFKCPECNYGCNEKRSLNRHLLIHKNIKLFKCSECNYGCNEKRSLKRHLLRHGNASRKEP